VPAQGPVPTRERIVRAAMRLFQQRGYHAVGLAEILDEARAPKGSMYHHFPLGKEQIAIAAVERIHADLMAMLRKLHADGRSLDELIRRLAKGIGQWLKASEWREGALLASTTVGAVPELPKLHAAIKQAFDDWREYLAARLRDRGWRHAAAYAMAQTIVASIEGAMILARIDQDERTLTAVADTLARMIAVGDRPG
jgi:TetR/AcrR family transcriptional repressor of lmrAB and yxaGH operons